MTLPSYGSDEALPESLAEPTRTRWPTVVGVIGLVYAGLGLCGGVLGGLSLAFNETLVAMGGIKPPPMPSELRLSGIIGSVASLLLGIVLIVGAMSLLGRRRRAGPILMTWAIAAVVLTLGGVAWSLRTAPMGEKYQEQIMAEQRRVILERTGRPMPEAQLEVSKTITTVFTYAFMTLPFVFPLFMAFFLTGEKRRGEMASWS